MTGGYGRYAPSPSSDLHFGNLRTAVVAFLAARADGLGFRMRVEDLDDRGREAIAARQLADLAALGITWDGPVWYSSQRRAAYDAAIDQLTDQGLTFECFCSRREVATAPRAPHSPPGTYPGTCLNLTRAERSSRAAGRSAAIRLRAEVSAWPVTDRRAGLTHQPVDSFCLRRSDGVAAYNLAVVVDDAAQQVTQVTRGDDLLVSAGRQAYLAHLLGLPEFHYLHIGLVYNSKGERLAKRDQAFAGSALWEAYGGADGLLGGIGHSLGLAAPGEKLTLDALAERYANGGAQMGDWTV
jgi:glutamyl-tRNA synthetase